MILALWRFLARLLCPDRALRRPSVDEQLLADRDWLEMNL